MRTSAVLPRASPEAGPLHRGCIRRCESQLRWVSPYEGFLKPSVGELGSIDQQPGRIPDQFVDAASPLKVAVLSACACFQNASWTSRIECRPSQISRGFKSGLRDGIVIGFRPAAPILWVTVARIEWWFGLRWACNLALSYGRFSDFTRAGRPRGFATHRCWIGSRASETRTRLRRLSRGTDRWFSVFAADWFATRRTPRMRFRQRS